MPSGVPVHPGRPTLGPNQEVDNAQGPSPSSAQDHPLSPSPGTQTIGVVCWPQRLELAQTALPRGQKAASPAHEWVLRPPDGAWAQQAAEAAGLEALMADAGRRPARHRSPPRSEWPLETPWVGPAADQARRGPAHDRRVPGARGQVPRVRSHAPVCTRPLRVRACGRSRQASRESPGGQLETRWTLPRGSLWAPSLVDQPGDRQRSPGLTSQGLWPRTSDCHLPCGQPSAFHKVPTSWDFPPLKIRL